MELEELELELIDAGLEEIEEEEGLVLAYANYTDFGNMNQKFEELGIELTKAELKEFQIIHNHLLKLNKKILVN